MQSAAAHSAVHARPATFPRRVKGPGSLARSSLSNHDETQQGGCAQAVAGRSNFDGCQPGKMSFHLAAPDARYTSLLPWLTQTRRTAVCFLSPLHRLKPTLTARDDRTLRVGFTTAFQGATSLRRGPSLRGLLPVFPCENTVNGHEGRLAALKLCVTILLVAI
ncbi:hypothetical protein BU25DRAFT_71027 [Macroventuria anomochaeta]|uniref:Uncharacterized protein n=1 Tax=Macroventuria anomochaeta TaxID=301207 RepID=A0ACB6RZA2_9PLEO|nr:uncharacterized protein BU25DRAFT_71027 [Macroventuria anomochaeta]KAF2627211.1 hypothetical protein BU25DRAFT_71027 [Macroventuria anomochaeta]